MPGTHARHESGQIPHSASSQVPGALPGALQDNALENQACPAKEQGSRPFAVTFAGAGPGAVDLLTLRALQALKNADLVLYAGSLVNPQLLDLCKPGCRLEDASRLSLAEQVALMSTHARKGWRVVRLHSGDPSLYGAIREQMTALASLGIPSVVIPGVTSALAAAASLGCELTLPEVSQSVVLTRSQGRTPLPSAQAPAAFARTNATLVFYLSAGHFAELSHELVSDGGLAPDTPCAAVMRVSWPDERIVRGTLATIAGQAARAGMTRQTLLLVGEATRPVHAMHQGTGAEDAQHNKAQPRASRLYAADFSHGYRNTLASEAFTGPIGVLSASTDGLRVARQICQALGSQATLLDGPQALQTHWQDVAGFVCVAATGLIVRLAAPLLQSKATDPALVCLDRDGRFVVSLCGGHLAGANRLARRVARITQGQAVISTATDCAGLVAFDEAAAREGARILNPEALVALNRALLEGETIDFHGPASLWEHYWRNVPHVRLAADTARDSAQNSAQDSAQPHAAARLAVYWDVPPTDDSADDPSETALVVRRASLVLGAGCHRDVDPELFCACALDYLQGAGVEPEDIACVASLAKKGEEPALQALMQRLGCPFAGYAPEELARVEGVVTRSATVHRYMGTTSVSEAAALACARRLGGSARLVAPREARHKCMTFALARVGHGTPVATDCPAPDMPGQDDPFAATPCGRLVVAGLGSGEPGSLTLDVARALEEAEVVVGYTTYMDMVRRLLGPETSGPGASDREYLQSGMRDEIGRCHLAFERALQGKRVCLVCSGDPGLLAMAGLVLELKSRNAAYRSVPVTILPGVTAALLAGARLGAPLQNGCVLLSLSDLLVPASEVLRNVACALSSALPLAVYNPAGKKRRILLHKTLELAKQLRGDDLPCALVREAGKPAEEVWTGLLKDLPQDRVDMSTLLILGSHRSRLEDGIFYEARGYEDKYGDKYGDRGAPPAEKSGEHHA